MVVEVLLSTPVTVLLHGIATVTFAGAAIKAIRNYRKTKSISNFWLIFAIAVTLGATFTAMDVLVAFGIFPELLDELDRWVALMFILFLIMTSIETLTSPIEVTIE